MANLAASPLTSLFALFTAVTFPHYTAMAQVPASLRNMVLHKTECSGYTQMVQPVTMLNAW